MNTPEPPGNGGCCNELDEAWHNPLHKRHMSFDPSIKSHVNPSQAEASLVDEPTLSTWSRAKYNCEVRRELTFNDVRD